ncbi:MAG: SelL-related redox protein [Phycisphaerales bacterium JB039]
MSTAPRWARMTLLLAGAYNLLWGAAVVLAPNLAFNLAGLDLPRYPQIWQCVGMIVGVYGIGYLIAAGDPRRHWPITLVGLLGKIFGPIGFIGAAMDGTLPWAFGLTIVTNDLIWWIPFGLILWDAAYNRDAPAPDAATLPARDAMAHVQTSAGKSLLELSQVRPALVIFLRHSGCTFCREAIVDIGRRRAAIEKGAQLVLVHMGPPGSLDGLLERHGLAGVATISDPERVLYRAFELRRGGLLQLLGPKAWWRGFLATLRGHTVGKLVGDGFQMPGAFLVRDGSIISAFRHESVADRPDYVQMACAAV